MSNRAWVTLATNDSYGLGALVLAHSLRRAGSTYPSVVMITPTVTDAMKERLSAVFAEVVLVDVLDSRDAAHLALLQRPELGITFTKLHCWSLTQYEKCVFLDADTLIVQNCDELFEREELSAAPDVGWPDCFNSGVFVFKPSKETFDALIKFAQERGSFDGGDQGLLNSFFSSWAHGDITKHLPFLYNVTSAAFYSYLPALQHFGQNLKIIHFIGAAKPWLQAFNWETRSVEGSGHLQGTLQLWWDLFVSSVHPQLDTTMVEVDPPPEIPPPDLLHHYEPPLDPNSQFPWHHPESGNSQESEQSNVEFSQFHDPWENYRGNIPCSGYEHQRDQNFTVGRVEITHDLRNFVWEYNSHVDDTHNTDTNNFEEFRTDPNIHYDSHSNNHAPQVEEKTYIEDWSNSSQRNSNFQSYNTSLISNIIPPNSTINYTTNEIENYLPNGVSNGHSDNDNNYEENIIPRHPYDGYYLKHIPTVDVQGRKICSHELPPTPPPSPPLDLVLDVENGTEFHSGVAGNLARVAPGPSAVQHDALNELTRRQGWEAGNIDYMGADSFDNIWAKISQTLAQPKISPPKETSLPTESDAIVQTLPAETADINQPQQTTEAIATPAVQPTVPAAETTIAAVEQIPPVAVDVPVAPTQVPSVAAEVSPVAVEIPPMAVEIPPMAVEIPPVAVEIPPVAVEIPPVAIEVPHVETEVSPVTVEVPHVPTEVSPVAVEVPPVETEVSPVAVEVPHVPTEVSPVTVEVPPVETEVSPMAVEVPHVPTEVSPVAVEVPPVETEVSPVAVEVPHVPTEVSPVAVEVPHVATEVSPVAVEVPPVAVDIAPVTEEVPVPAVEVPLSSPAVDTPTVLQVTPGATETVPAAVEAIPSAADFSTKTIAPESDVPLVACESQNKEPKEQPTDVTKDDPKVEATPAVPIPEQKACEPKPNTEQVPPIPDSKPTKINEGETKLSTDVPISVPDKSNDSSEVPAPAKSLDLSTASSDSPPLAQTPAKEEASLPTAAKSVGDGKGRKPAEKLQLCPPAHADPLPTPDSELEDAATLAQSIIAGELATPTVTSPTPPAPLTPASPPVDKRLAAETSVPYTPPAGPVSLAQIGVKGKPTTAEQIASSIEVKSDQATPPSTPTEQAAPKETAPKKKIVKKVVKKEAAAPSGEGGPVPPPRKKEKKPKDK